MAIDHIDVFYILRAASPNVDLVIKNKMMMMMMMMTPWWNIQNGENENLCFYK
jgi:hypothetical protein